MLVCKHVVSRQETNTEHERSHVSAGNARTPQQGTRIPQKAKSTRGPRTMTRSMTTATRTATSLAIIREMTILSATWGPQFLRSEPNTNSRHLFKKGSQARAESNITHKSMDPSARLEPPTNVLSAHMKSHPSSSSLSSRIPKKTRHTYLKSRHSPGGSIAGPPE